MSQNFNITERGLPRAVGLGSHWSSEHSVVNHLYFHILSILHSWNSLAWDLIYLMNGLASWLPSTQLVGLWHLHSFLLWVSAHFVCCLLFIRSLQQSPFSFLSLFVSTTFIGKQTPDLAWLNEWSDPELCDWSCYPSFFSYFTDLSYIGLVAYFWASSVQTIVFVLSGQKAYPLQKWPRILQFLHVLLYTTITIFREFNV